MLVGQLGESGWWMEGIDEGRLRGILLLLEGCLQG